MGAGGRSSRRDGAIRDGCALRPRRVTLIGNQYFVETWAGEDLYAGYRFDVLFVAAAAATALARTDAIFIDAVLAFRHRAVVTLVCGIAAVGMGILATENGASPGMAATAVGSRMLLVALTPTVLASHVAADSTGRERRSVPACHRDDRRSVDGGQLQLRPRRRRPLGCRSRGSCCRDHRRCLVVVPRARSATTRRGTLTTRSRPSTLMPNPLAR